MDFIYFFLVFLLALAVIFLSFLHQKLKIKRNPNLPPGPKGLPFIGNFHQFDSSASHHYLWKLSQKYGPLMSLRLGPKQMLVVSSAKMAKEVMKTHDLIFCTRPSPLSTSQKTFTYNAKDVALAPYGTYWREIRKICMVHLFNFNRVQSYRPIREFEINHLLDKISKSAANANNLSELMTSLTSIIICRVAFGKRCDEGSRFYALLGEIQALFGSLFVSDYFPMLGFIDKLTGLSSRLDKSFKEFDNFIEQMIKEHLDPNRSNPEHSTGILDVLIEVSKDNSHLTLDHIKAVLTDIFLAGTETSAATVVWAMTFLMKNPVTMKKAQEEVRFIIGNKGFVNEDDTQKLIYLKAVVKETMRLQPPVPLLLPREASHHCKLNGYDIQAKTIIQVNAWAIGRDPQVWESPEMFMPERFIDNSIDLKGQDFELIPFGAGRRLCPGISMGLATVELSLANLIYKFDWDMPDGLKIEDLDMDASQGIVTHKKNALCLIAGKHI